MLNRALKLLSTWKFFHEEYESLEKTFAFAYPENRVQSTVRQLNDSNCLREEKNSNRNRAAF